MAPYHHREHVSLLSGAIPADTKFFSDKRAARRFRNAVVNLLVPPVTEKISGVNTAAAAVAAAAATAATAGYCCCYYCYYYLKNNFI